jgi:succinate dehydrogenase / fumarate reductase cytochrome b subunit
MHGFQSAWRSLGIMHRKYTPVIQGIGIAFSFFITLGFAIIPVFFYFFRQPNQ